MLLLAGAVDFALLFTNKQDVDDGPPQADGVGLALKMKKLLPEVCVFSCCRLPALPATHT